MTSHLQAVDLASLAEEAAVARLVYTFSRCLDERDWQGYSETFTEDGVFEVFGAQRVGREAIRTGAMELGRYEATQHYNTNITVEISGPTATAASALLAVHIPRTADPDKHADVGGQYRYECARTTDGWRFTSVRLDINWTSGLALSL